MPRRAGPVAEYFVSAEAPADEMLIGAIVAAPMRRDIVGKTGSASLGLPAFSGEHR